MASLLQGFASVNTEQAGASGQRLTLEAQESRVISAYEHALSLIQAQRPDEAQAALRQLLAQPVVDECATDQLHRIKFLSLRNLAELLARQPGAVHDALLVFCQATEVVGDDAVLWNKLGTLAGEAGYWAVARNAFERGLELDPQHPTMVDKLLQLLLHVGDAEAAAVLAAALLRQNPRHAAARSILMQRRRNRPLPALAAGLLQLAALPSGAAGGGQHLAADTVARHLQSGHLHHAADRPRSLDQPTWQQLLHHSLLFLSSNRLAEGGSSTPTAAAAVAVGTLAEQRTSRGVASLVRFNFRKAPQLPAQPTALATGASTTPPAGAAAAAAAPTVPVGLQQGAAAAGGLAAAAATDANALEPAADDCSAPAAATAAASPGLPAGPAAAATPAAGASDAAATPRALPAADTTPAALSEPGSSGLDVLLPRGEEVRLRQAAPPADEQQEQRHPNGRGSSGSGRKLETRATRSRAANGKAGVLVAPMAASTGQHQTPEEDAWELLSTLGPLLSAPPPPPSAAAAAASPLLSSPSKQGRPGGGGGGGDKQQAAGEAQRQLEEEEAVKAFAARLPRAGVGRQELALLLLGTLASSSSAAKLAAPARQQLLQVAQQVQHDVSQLPAGQCLVLGELFADAAAAATATAAAGGSGAQGQGSLGPAAAAAASSNAVAAAPAGHAGSDGVSSGGSGMLRRISSIRARRGELSLPTLQHSARLWLSRYRLAEAEAAGSHSRAGQAADDGPVGGMVRYWWAIGRLMESSGDMPAASAAYDNCQQGVHLLGGCTTLLPHCQADGSISPASLHAKKEALQLHTVLESAQQSAAAADHAAVVAALAPVLLCCSDKEQQMLLLDQQQWLQGMRMLLDAATASSSWGLVLRCHLRLLNALLPHVPQQLLPLIQGEEEEGAASDLSPQARQAAAQQLVEQQAAADALEAAASFLQQRHATLTLAAPSNGSGDASSSTDGSCQQMAGQQQQLALHAMECAMYEAVQQQLLLATASCGAALAAAGPAAAESRLNLKVNAAGPAMCNAATVLLRLSSLAAGGRQSPQSAGTVPHTARLEAVEKAQEVAWHLWNALGSAQVLMKRHGRFVQACLSELRAQLDQREALVPQLVSTDAAAVAAARAAAMDSAAAAAADAAVEAEELHATLTAGLHHCLYWLYGLELPGLNKQDDNWGGYAQAKGANETAAARQLTSQQAVADVWPLVEAHLVHDLQHVDKHRGFLQAAAAVFPCPPAAIGEQSAAAWQQLTAAAEPPILPCDELDEEAGTSGSPMQQLLRLAGQTGGMGPVGGIDAARHIQQGDQQAAEPMAADGEGAVMAAARTTVQDQGEQQYEEVYRSLYHLLGALQAAEGASVGNFLAEGAEAAVEEQLRAVKWDLCYNARRFSSWERLAAVYHEAADNLLNQASKVLTHREWSYDRDLQVRAKRWRRLGYWASAGAWVSAPGVDDEVMLLTATGSRLLHDALRTLPRQDPMASSAAWQRVKGSRRYRDSCRAALSAFERSWSTADIQEEMHWEVLLSQARCRRKLQEPARDWLPLMARACNCASDEEGGVLLAVYALHASRMRLLVGLPASARWAAGGGRQQGDSNGSGSNGQRQRPAREQQQGTEAEQELLQVVGSHCFLGATRRALCSASQLGEVPLGEAEQRALWEGLLEDCCAAMQWCLDKDKNFHRAAYRLAAALQFTNQPHKAVSVLAPFFSRAKHAFLPVMVPIQETKVDGGGKRGRPGGSKRAGSRGDAEHMQLQEREQEDAEGGTAQSSWGEAPAWLASVGLEEDEAAFGTRLRKTMRLYLSCLADAAIAAASGQAPEAGRPPPLEVLQAAAAYLAAPPPGASKAWEGCGKLARGHFLLALVSGLRSCCPVEQLLAQLPVPSPFPPSAAAGNGALGTSSRTGAEAGGAAAAMELDDSHAQDEQQQPAAQQTPGAALTAAATATAAAASGAAPTSALAPTSAVHATPADASAAATAAGAGRSIWRSLPTPATQGRHQLAAHLLRVAARLDAATAGPLLAKAQQVFSEYALHTDGDDKWRAVAAPSMQEAQSITTSELASDADLGLLSKPELLSKVFSLYATLYVHLLQQHGEADKLLQLLQAMKKRLKNFGAAEPRQARFLRHQALVLANALLGTVQASLSNAEMEAGVALRHCAAAAAAAATPMEVEGQAAAGQEAAGPEHAGSAVSLSPGLVGKPAEQQEQRSPLPSTQQPQQASLDASPAAQQSAQRGSSAGQQHPAAAAHTPAAAGLLLRRGGTPATDLRAVLGTPGALPSAEQQLMQERALALLMLSHGFYKDIVVRWLQVVGPAAGGSSAASSTARDELRALVSSSQEAVLRAYCLYSRFALPPPAAAAGPGAPSRAEQLKAADELVKQQRRQSKQHGGGGGGAAGRQQAAAAATGGLLPPIAEGGEERPVGARKRGAAGEAVPRSIRKRGRSNTAEPEDRRTQQEEEQQQHAPAADEAADMQQVVQGVVASVTMLA